MKSIKVSQTVKKIASNTFYQLISKVITMTITFGLSIMISINYGSEGYGFFSILQSIPALFYIIAEFGLNAISAREISKKTKEIESVFSNILFLRLIISVLGVIACLILSFALYQDEQLRFGLALASLIIVSQSLIMSTNLIFQIKLKYDLSSLSNVIGYLLILFFSIYFINNSVDLAYINFLYVIGGFITLTINLILIYKRFIRVSFDFDKSYLKYMFAESWPLGLMFLFSQINFRADSILLSTLKIPENFGSNLQAVGVYSFPYKIFEVLLVVPTFMMNSLYPILLDRYQKGEMEFKKFFNKALAMFLSVGLLVTFLGYLGIFIIEKYQIVNTYFNQDFINSPDILRILLLGLVFFFLSQPLAWVFVVKEKQIILPLFYFLAAVLNLFLNFVFIPQFGYFASSYITWLTELIILILLFLTAKIKKWI
jgi:O-antigen/teichoic acid export membrane protein